MGFNSFKVVIEPDYGVFLPGQVITGSIQATAGSEIRCRAVQISCKGKAKVHWRERVGDSHRNYDAKEEYFNLTVLVWTHPSGRIHGGNHSWPFQFTIPVGCPSSFEGTKGWVRYRVKAKAEIPFGIDQKSSVYFSVNDPADLNFIDDAKKPLAVQKADTTCCWCCMKGPVQLNFNCPRSGAVIGENFKIRGEVSNEGSKQVKDTEIILTQKAKYFAGGKTETSVDVIGKIKNGSIPSGESFYYEDVPLKIESVVPNLARCNIIDVNYTIEFSANFGACASVSEKLPFTIGTVPFIAERTNSVPSQPLMPPVPQPHLSTAPPPYAPTDPAQPEIGFKKAQWETFSDEVPSAPPTEFAPPMPTPGMPMPTPGMPMPTPGMPMHTPGMPMPTPGMPMPAGAYSVPPQNSYPIKGPPMPEVCYLAPKRWARLDSKAPPPKYLSYDGVIE